MCVSAKTTTASSGTGALIMQDGTASNAEQGFASNYQQYGTPEVVDISPMETMKESVEYGKLQDLYNKQGVGDENYRLRNLVRDQVTQDVENVDPALQREMVKAGMMDAALSGAGAGSGRGSAIAQNVLGRRYLDYRRGSQDQAMKFMGANPSDRALPTGQELTGLKYLNRQNYADARNQKKANMFAIDQANMQGRNARGERNIASAQQWGANTATAMNNMAGANAANRGQMIGAGIGMAGMLGGAAIM